MTQMECLLGIDEAAKILGIPRTSLHGKVQRRQVPFATNSIAVFYFHPVPFEIPSRPTPSNPGFGGRVNDERG